MWGGLGVAVIRHSARMAQYSAIASYGRALGVRYPRLSRRTKSDTKRVVGWVEAALSGPKPNIHGTRSKRLRFAALSRKKSNLDLFRNAAGSKCERGEGAHQAPSASDGRRRPRAQRGFPLPVA